MSYIFFFYVLLHSLGGEAEIAVVCLISRPSRTFFFDLLWRFFLRLPKVRFFPHSKVNFFSQSQRPHRPCRDVTVPKSQAAHRACWDSTLLARPMRPLTFLWLLLTFFLKKKFRFQHGVGTAPNRCALLIDLYLSPFDTFCLFVFGFFFVTTVRPWHGGT